MKVHKLTDLNIDQNGLEVMDHLPAEDPIALCYDETDRYVNGFIRWHWHPQPELVLSLTDFELHIADECIRLAPGEGIFINSGQLHMFRSPDDAPGAKSYTLLFAQEYIAPEGSLIFENCMRPIIDHPSLPYIIFRRDDGWQSAFLDALQELIDLRTSTAPGIELTIRNKLCELWLMMLRNIDLLPTHPGSRHSRQSQFRLKQMLSFIRRNYMEHITLDDVARSALVSKSECLRVFRSRFEMTPIQYLIQCRLELACHLLRSSSCSIKEISARCGFDDAGYFGRAFRKKYGMTPLNYRRLGEEQAAFKALSENT